MSSGYTGKAEDAVSVVRSILRELHAKNAPFMAGSIAYSAFVSLLPLVLLAFIVASALGGQRLVDYLLRLTENYLTPAGQNLLVDSVTQSTGRAGLSVLGLVVLLWGVLRVFRALDTAFSAIYGTQRRNDLLNQFRDGVVVLLALGVALLSVVVASLALALLPRLPFTAVLNPLLLIVGLTVAFLPMYYVFPDTEMSIREALPGAVIAAVGWTVLEAVFSIYIVYSSVSELYGVIGGVLLLVTWLYFGSLVVLAGAAANVVLGEHAPASPTQVADPPDSPTRS